MKLENIKSCNVCGSIRLTPRLNIPIPDIMTDEDIYRDVLQCEDCDTLHYIEDGELSWEFNCSIDEQIGKRKKILK